MTMPFPGMDPYLEHPALWPGLQTRLAVGLANRLSPQIKPRYLADVEVREFVEDPVRHLEIRECYITILDRYRDLAVVTVIMLVSPSNKVAGPGRDSYLAKQHEILASECNFVEIDLLRSGQHVMSVPEPFLESAKPFDYLVCVNQWPDRKCLELYPCQLRDPLPTIGVPLADPYADAPPAIRAALERAGPGRHRGPDAPLDIQATLEQVYEEGGYMLRLRYDEPCVPPLSPADQEWASDRWLTYRRTHPDLFPDDHSG